MVTSLRDSGLEVTGGVPWGTHFCQFYDTKEDLEEILVPYFKAGLEGGEFCMWITSPDLSKKEAEAALTRAVPNFEHYLSKGQIEIIPHTEWYLRGGKFELNRVLNGWVDRLKQAEAKGFTGLRLSGNTVWLEKKDWQSFTDYEEAINRVIGQYRMIALCTYSLKKCGAIEIMDVVRNHEFALLKSGERWQKIQTSEQQEKESELRKVNRALKALGQSSEAMMRANNEKAYLEDVCKIIVEDCGYKMVWIGLAEEDAAKSVRPVAWSGFEQGYLDTLKITWADSERGHGPTGTAIRTGKPCGCRNMLTDPNVKPWRSEALKRGFQSSIAVPLLSQGKAFGAITIYSKEQDPFSEEEVELLAKLADDVAYGIGALRDRMALHEYTEKLSDQFLEAKRAEQRLNLLAETTSKLLQTDSPQSVVNELCQKVKEFLDCDAFFNFVVDEELDRLHLNTCGGIPEEEAKKIEWLDYGIAVCGCAARDGCRIVAEDIANSSDPHVALVRSYGIQAYACHPLMAQGKVIGTLSFGTRKKKSFSDDELSLMKTVADHVAIAMERKRTQEMLQQTNFVLEQRVEERTEEVRRNSRFLEAFFHHSLDSLVFLDKNFNFIRVNEVYARSCHREVSSFPGHNHFEFFPHPENQAIFENVVRTKTPHMAIAKPFQFPDHPEWGVTYWDWTLVPVLDAQGEVDFLVFSLRDVTKHEQAQQQVRTASRYARSLLEASLDPLVTISPEGKITDVNEATELATGRDRSDLIGTDFSSYFTEPEKANAGYRKVIVEGFIRDYELTLRHVSGRTMDVVYNASVYRNEAGAVQGVFAAVRDITERKRIEQVLQQSESRYRSLVTATTQVVWTTDEHGLVVDIPHWRAFTGQTVEEIRGAGWVDALHPEDRERTKAIWEESVRKQSLYDTEYRLRRKDGVYRDVSVRGVPVFDHAGRLCEWVGTCTDITEKREAEKRREVTNALLSLFAQKTSMDEYIEAVASVIQGWSGAECLGIRVMEKDGSLPYKAALGFPKEFVELEGTVSLRKDRCCCTRAATGVFEDCEKALTTTNGSYHFGDSIGFAESLTPEQREPYRSHCMKFGYASLAIIPIRDKNQVLGLIHLADQRKARFTADTINFLELMSPLIGEVLRRFQAESELAEYREHLEELVKKRTSELESANGLLQTENKERMQAEEALRHSKELLSQQAKHLEILVRERTAKLEETVNELEHFSYSITHDMRAPLRAMQGFAQILLREECHQCENPGAKEFLQRIATAADRMDHLIQDALAFSQVVRTEYPRHPIDVGVFLKALIKDYPNLHPPKVEISLDGEFPVVMGNEAGLTQCFSNLLNNACKFVAPGVKPKIRVWAESIPNSNPHEPTYVRVWVEDNGIGIPKNARKTIFGMFQQLNKGYEGTGIGLALVRKAAERMGGKVDVESELGKGSRFWLEFQKA
jgi:PAS domain S-box-containing protein